MADMFTRCPECDTAFRLSAEHLTQARGRVRCGCCGHAFSIADRVYDELPDVEVSEEEGPIPVFGRASAEPELSGSSTQGVSEDDVDESLQILMQAPRVDEAEDEDDDEDYADAARMPVDDDVTGIDAGPTLSEPVDDDEILPALGDSSDTRWLEDELLPLQQERAKRRRWPWALLAVLLLLGVLLQLAWFERERLVEEWPQLMAVYAPVCDYLPCATGQPLDQQGVVVMLGRDVRNHPDVENALLVNATMMNRGSETLPFPELEFVLFDSAGNAIGARRFQPGEYLDKSIDIGTGMAPQQPVHIVLEVADVSTGAVSFEFRFL